MKATDWGEERDFPIEIRQSSRQCLTRCFQRYLSAARKVNTTAESFAIGREVESRAQALASEGKDANQIAKILFDADPEGHNYGIGIVLDSQGQAVATSETLLRYMVEEVEGSGGGYYQNSSALMEKLKSTVLGWQRIPKPLWGSFELILASDAGTGAVKSAVEIALTMDESLNSIAVEELGWAGLLRDRQELPRWFPGIFRRWHYDRRRRLADLSGGADEHDWSRDSRVRHSRAC